MDPNWPPSAPLDAESHRLAASWERHSPEFLSSYLVADVEDPRLNVQSILTRHFLALALDGGLTCDLAEAEIHFAADLNWILAAARELRDPEALASILDALRRGADNAEGFPIPAFVRASFARLPNTVQSFSIPNYLAQALESTTFAGPDPILPAGVLDLFASFWRQALPSSHAAPPTVLEPACGSANDYRFLDTFGLARLIHYRGVDISPKNIANARTLFPGIRFDPGTAFVLDAADKSVDLCFVHDLFEHLSPNGLAAALDEVCRVTRHGLCLHFFNMDEIPEHIIRPVDDYHWNLLSLTRILEHLERNGFSGQAFHIGTYLRWRVGCPSTHNPNAYTLVLAAVPPTGDPQLPS